jgi:hypothetical protein
MTTCLHLQLRLRICGALCPLPGACTGTNLHMHTICNLSHFCIDDMYVGYLGTEGRGEVLKLSQGGVQAP